MSSYNRDQPNKYNYYSKQRQNITKPSSYYSSARDRQSQTQRPKYSTQKYYNDPKYERRQSNQQRRQFHHQRRQFNNQRKQFNNQRKQFNYQRRQYNPQFSRYNKFTPSQYTNKQPQIYPLERQKAQSSSGKYIQMPKPLDKYKQTYNYKNSKESYLNSQTPKYQQRHQPQQQRPKFRQGYSNSYKYQSQRGYNQNSGAYPKYSGPYGKQLSRQAPKQFNKYDHNYDKNINPSRQRQRSRSRDKDYNQKLRQNRYEKSNTYSSKPNYERNDLQNKYRKTSKDQPNNQNKPSTHQEKLVIVSRNSSQSHYKSQRQYSDSKYSSSSQKNKKSQTKSKLEFRQKDQPEYNNKISKIPVLQINLSNKLENQSEKTHNPQDKKIYQSPLKIKRTIQQQPKGIISIKVKSITKNKSSKQRQLKHKKDRTQKSSKSKDKSDSKQRSKKKSHRKRNSSNSSYSSSSHSSSSSSSSSNKSSSSSSSRSSQSMNSNNSSLRESKYNQNRQYKDYYQSRNNFGSSSRYPAPNYTRRQTNFNSTYQRKSFQSFKNQNYQRKTNEQPKYTQVEQKSRQSQAKMLNRQKDSSVNQINDKQKYKGTLLNQNTQENAAQSKPFQNVQSYQNKFNNQQRTYNTYKRTYSNNFNPTGDSNSNQLNNAPYNRMFYQSNQNHTTNNFQNIRPNYSKNQFPYPSYANASQVIPPIQQKPDPLPQNYNNYALQWQKLYQNNTRNVNNSSNLIPQYPIPQNNYYTNINHSNNVTNRNQYPQNNGNEGDIKGVMINNLVSMDKGNIKINNQRVQNSMTSPIPPIQINKSSISPNNNIYDQNQNYLNKKPFYPIYGQNAYNYQNNPYNQQSINQYQPYMRRSVSQMVPQSKVNEQNSTPFQIQRLNSQTITNTNQARNYFQYQQSKYTIQKQQQQIALMQQKFKRQNQLKKISILIPCSKTLQLIEKAKQNLSVPTIKTNFILLQAFNHMNNYKKQTMNQNLKQKLDQDLKSNYNQQKNKVFQNLRLLNNQYDSQQCKIQDKSKQSKQQQHFSQSMDVENHTQKIQQTKIQQAKIQKGQLFQQNNQLKIKKQINNNITEPEGVKARVFLWKKPQMSQNLRQLKSSIELMRKASLNLSDISRRMKMKYQNS